MIGLIPTKLWTSKQDFYMQPTEFNDQYGYYGLTLQIQMTHMCISGVDHPANDAVQCMVIKQTMYIFGGWVKIILGADWSIIYTEIILIIILSRPLCVNIYASVS